MKALTLSILLLASIWAEAQIGPAASIALIKEMSIQEITLADTFLIDQIRLLIKRESVSDTSFSKKGYVNVFIENHWYKGEEVLRSYHINKQFVSLDELENNRQYPLYYTFIDGRIVLVHMWVLKEVVQYKFSEASKRAFLERLEPFLAPKVYTEWPDAKGVMKEVKNHRPGDTFFLHGGKNIYIFKVRSNKPPLIEDARY